MLTRIKSALTFYAETKVIHMQLKVEDLMFQLHEQFRANWQLFRQLPKIRRFLSGTIVLWILGVFTVELAFSQPGSSAELPEAIQAATGFLFSMLLALALAGSIRMTFRRRRGARQA